MHSAAVYGAASVGPRLAMFFLLPAYAVVLEPDELGGYAVASAVTSIVAVVMSVGLEYSVTRTAVRLQATPLRLQRYLNTLWVAVAAWGTLLAFGLGVIGTVCLSTTAAFSQLMLWLALVSAVLTAVLHTVGLAALRAAERKAAFSAVALTQGICAVLLSMVAVLVLDWGGAGWVAGVALGNGIGVGVAAALVPLRFPRQLALGRVITSVRFGFPLVPHGLALTILLLGDRLVVGAVFEANEVGVYGLAAMLALPVSLGLSAVQQALMPIYARAAYAVKSPTDVLRELALTQVALASGSVLIVALLGPLVVEHLFSRAYSGAASAVGLLALGFGLQGVYLVPMSRLTLVSGRTRGIWPWTMLSAFTSLTWIALAGPLWGLSAAALGVPLGFGILATCVVLQASRSGVQHDLGSVEVIGTILAAGALYVASASLQAEATHVQLLIRAAAIGAFVVTAVVLVASHRRRAEARGRAT